MGTRQWAALGAIEVQHTALDRARSQPREPCVQAIGRQPQRARDGALGPLRAPPPEQTTRYRLLQQHAASFIAHTEASTGSALRRFIKDEFDAFLL